MDFRLPLPKLLELIRDSCMYTFLITYESLSGDVAEIPFAIPSWVPANHLEKNAYTAMS